MRAEHQLPVVHGKSEVQVPDCPETSTTPEWPEMPECPECPETQTHTSLQVKLEDVQARAATEEGQPSRQP